MAIHTVTLPWFSRICSPNSSNNRNWRKKHAARKSQKNHAYQLSQHLPKASPKKNIPLSIQFCPNTSGNDLDNCLASIKGALDGIAQHIGVDDSLFRPITIDFGSKSNPAKIDISLSY